MRLAIRSSFSVRSMLRRGNGGFRGAARTLIPPCSSPQPEGTRPRATAIQAEVGAKRPAKPRHPWLRRIGLVVLLIMAGLLLSIIAFRFINPPVTSVMIAETPHGATLHDPW